MVIEIEIETHACMGWMDDGHESDGTKAGPGRGGRTGQGLREGKGRDGKRRGLVYHVRVDDGWGRDSKIIRSGERWSNRR